MPQFFQPTLLNSKFLYKRGALIARLVLVNIPVPAQRRTFKSFVCFDVTFYCKQACKLLIFISKERKTLFCGKFFKPYGPMCILVKMVTLCPALCFLKSLPTFKALTVIADISCSQALYSCEAMHYQSCIECFFKIYSQFVLSDHMRRCFL